MIEEARLRAPAPNWYQQADRNGQRDGQQAERARRELPSSPGRADRGIARSGLVPGAGSRSPVAGRREALPVLPTAQDVRALAPDQVRLPYAVKVSGVVTVLSGWKDSFFFLDDTAGISVDRADGGVVVRPGDAVEIKGESAPGLFAPVIIARRVRVLGRRELPRPLLLSFDQLAGGKEDSKWVEIRGVVRSAAVREAGADRCSSSTSTWAGARSPRA